MSLLPLLKLHVYYYDIVVMYHWRINRIQNNTFTHSSNLNSRPERSILGRLSARFSGGDCKIYAAVVERVILPG